MAATGNKANTTASFDSPLEALAAEPYRFDFFQAVRLLRWAARERGDQGESVGGRPVGQSFSPEEEAVRFRSLPSLSFPSAAIHRLEWPGDDRERPPEMRVAFFGLFGPLGVLPRHYTQLIIDRARHKDTAFGDFLDLFNHRLISLYWRAWAKHRLPIAYEESQLDPGGPTEDPFTMVLYSLIGLGVRGLRDRRELSDTTFLYFAGHFAQSRPQAITLVAMISDHFSLEASVQQFRGQWLQLDRADQSRLPAARQGFDRQTPRNNRLGVDVVIGERVWSVENRFRVRLGPLNYRQFESFTPAGSQSTPLGQFVRAYVGPQYDFDVQLVLHQDEVPLAQLAAAGQPATCRLGWNSWAFSRPFSRDADDAAFVCEGLPTRG
jgi:type VI secretion system protein ImpH